MNAMLLLCHFPPSATLSAHPPTPHPPCPLTPQHTLPLPPSPTPRPLPHLSGPATRQPCPGSRTHRLPPRSRSHTRGPAQRPPLRLPLRGTAVDRLARTGTAAAARGWRWPRGRGQGRMQRPWDQARGGWASRGGTVSEPACKRVDWSEARGFITWRLGPSFWHWHCSRSTEPNTPLCSV